MSVISCQLFSCQLSDNQFLLTLEVVGDISYYSV